MTKDQQEWIEEKSLKADKGYILRENYRRDLQEAFSKGRNEGLDEAAKICEESVKWWSSMNVNECTKDPITLSKEIRNLKNGKK